MAAGFANSRKNRKECNCDFVVVGDQVFPKARRFISKGEELFVFYKFRTYELDVRQRTPSSARRTRRVRLVVHAEFGSAVKSY